MRKTQLAFAALIGALGLSVSSAQTATAPLAPNAALTSSTAAVPARPVTATAQGAAVPQLTAQDVNAWLDGFMPYAIGVGDIPGAVVVVVKDGQVVTSRGYGYANLASKTPVDPATTLFRPGSVSKLFTWTAVMQQVERGKIDLNADVNKYIDFKSPAYHGRPVTVLNLMTHTPGFEETVLAP